MKILKAYKKRNISKRFYLYFLLLDWKNIEKLLEIYTIYENVYLFMRVKYPRRCGLWRWWVGRHTDPSQMINSHKNRNMETRS